MLHDAWFRAQGQLAELAYQLLTQRIAELAAATLAKKPQAEKRAQMATKRATAESDAKVMQE